MGTERKIWIFACLVLVAVIFYSWWRNGRIQSAYISEKRISDSLRVTHAADGSTHYSKPITQIPEAEYRETNDSLIAELRKTVKARDLLQYTVAQLQTQGKIKVPVHDTLYWPAFTSDTPILAKTFSYTDSFLALKGNLYQDNISLDYTVNNPISVTSKWQRPKWYKKKELDVEIATLNPHTTVGGVQSYVVKQPPKRFYETRAFAFILGAAAGFALTK